MGDESSDATWHYRWGAKLTEDSLDFPDDMTRDAVNVTSEAIKEMIEAGVEQDDGLLDVAKKVKTFFDEKYDRSWHVVIGKNFGCHATHESRRFVYFYFSDTAFFDKGIMLFKAG